MTKREQILAAIRTALTGTTEPTVLDNWHVNYISEPPTDWEDYVVTPVAPVQVFA